MCFSGVFVLKQLKIYHCFLNVRMEEIDHYGIIKNSNSLGKQEPSFQMPQNYGGSIL